MCAIKCNEPTNFKGTNSYENVYYHQKSESVNIWYQQRSSFSVSISSGYLGIFSLILVVFNE